jgi:hypothetical protein
VRRMKLTSRRIPRRGGVLFLKVRTMLSFQNNAALQVDINGHKGMFYPRPNPPYSGSGVHAEALSLSAAAILLLNTAASQQVTVLRGGFGSTLGARSAESTRFLRTCSGRPR